MAPLGSLPRSGSLPTMAELSEVNAEEDRDDTIQVYVRVRPLSKREQSQSGAELPVVTLEEDQRSIVVQAAPTRRFRFDGVRGEDASQQEIFQLAARNVADGCLEGYNGTICVYGQTGAGKTYTMVGAVNSVQQMQSDPRRGIICRTIDYIFGEIKRRSQANKAISYSCRCSFLEIYKEQVTDLLDVTNVNLQLREDQLRGVYVERLSELEVADREEALELLLQGLQQRRTGSTHMNERSSRSHAIFTMTIEMCHVRSSGLSTRHQVRLNLVDLAGSERQMGVADVLKCSAMGGQAVPVKEASAINRSLSALTNVIMSLSLEEKAKRKSTGGHRPGFINYRDSKLTFLLRDSLGGNSRTAIVVNISPSAVCSSGTLSSMEFAARAKHIQCSPARKGELGCSVDDLVREVSALRRRVGELETGRESHSSRSAKSSGRSSACSTEEEEVELQARLSETKRDLIKAISQLAQVEAKLTLASADVDDLTQEAAKFHYVRDYVRAVPTTTTTTCFQLPTLISSVSSLHVPSTPKSTISAPRTPAQSTYQVESPRMLWTTSASPRPLQTAQVVAFAPQQSGRAQSPHRSSCAFLAPSSGLNAFGMRSSSPTQLARETRLLTA